MRKFVLKKLIKNLKQKRYHASSMLEVIVALAICMIFFGISMSIIVNSQRANNIRLKQKAQFILSFSDSIAFNQNVSLGNNTFTLETKIEENDTIPGVSRIVYSIFDNAGNKLGMKVVWRNNERSQEAETEIDNNWN